MTINHLRQRHVRRVLGVIPLGFIASSLLAGCCSAANPGTVLNVGCSPEPVLGTPAMPSPTRLAKVLSFSFNNIRLYPPPKSVQPRVSATQAWNVLVRSPDRVHGLQVNASYKLMLVDWNSTNPTVVSPKSGQRMLIWLVIGKHIWVSTMERSNDVHTPRCIYEAAMWPINATTGNLYGQMAYPPQPEFFH